MHIFRYALLDLKQLLQEICSFIWCHSWTHCILLRNSQWCLIVIIRSYHRWTENVRFLLEPLVDGIIIRWSGRGRGESEIPESLLFSTDLLHWCLLALYHRSANRTLCHALFRLIVIGNVIISFNWFQYWCNWIWCTKCFILICTCWYFLKERQTLQNLLQLVLGGWVVGLAVVFSWEVLICTLAVLNSKCWWLFRSEKGC